MDRVMKVNALVQKGIVPSDKAGLFVEAPEEALDVLLKVNVAAEGGIHVNGEKVSEEDVKLGLDMLKQKRTADKELKKTLVEQLKGNSRCKFTAEQLDGFSADALKTLAASLGATPPNFAPAGGGATPAQPKVNEAQTGLVSVPVIPFEMALKML